MSQNEPGRTDVETVESTEDNRPLWVPAKGTQWPSTAPRGILSEGTKYFLLVIGVIALVFAAAVAGSLRVLMAEDSGSSEA